ncbi:MAG: porin [Comamonas sp.]|nr:porin [Comamonas sp.]
MKKSLIALAVLGASGFAMAQSSVTLYGVADAGLGKVANGKTQMTSAGLLNNGNSRLGVKGVEDLGGGLKAGFNFESGLTLKNGDFAGSGGGFWGRAANMYLGGSWGTFLMGRTLNPSFYGFAAWELTGAANYTVVGNTFGFGGGNGPRNSSQFTYTTPNISGFSGSLGYIFSADNGGNAKWDLNAIYANGPMSVAITANKTQTQKTGWSLGGRYNFGQFIVAASYSDAYTVRRGFSIGGTALFGPASVTLDLTRDTKNPVKKYTNALLEGKYSLSKRTFVYADYLRLDGGNNYGVGVRHNF